MYTICEGPKLDVLRYQSVMLVDCQYGTIHQHNLFLQVQSVMLVDCQYGTIHQHNLFLQVRTYLYIDI